MAQVRSLIGTPLRGELTLPESKIPAALSKPSSIGPSLDNLQGLLSQVLRLSSTASAGARPPRILIEGKDARDEEADKATAPWSWTAAEASSTESSLFPFLVHLAVARDDPEGLSFALSVESNPEGSSLAISGGLANCADPASGRSPLHVAALNGSTRAANMLLKAGALVHVRDALGHTPLYYAARQGHEELVELLVKAGANLGGADVDGGYVSCAVSKAASAKDERTLRVWKKAGANAVCL